MDPEAFHSLVASLTAQIANQSLDDALERRLNAEHPAGSAVFEKMLAGCRAGTAAGWMCHREAAGIRYGRVIKSSAETHFFSVDVVDMNECVGPHHEHPNGEIDLIMPLEGSALFDGRGAGWKVYPPESEHFPTVSGGRAFVLYLLPQGAIRFTGKPFVASA
jgi:hypothetical protein